MRTKAAFLVGGAVGYVLGTRAGRQQFEKIRGAATKLWEDPRVQQGVADVEQRATSLVKEKGPELKEKIVGAVRSSDDDAPVTYSTGAGDSSNGSTS